MKLLCLFLVFLIIFSVSLTNINALSKDDKAKQLKEREAALKKIPKDDKIKSYKYNIIVLDLSNTCLKLLKANLKNGCLSYKDLAYFDNTNQKYSGKFFDDNGFYHRGKSLINNHEIVYKYSNNTIICADCPGKIAMQTRTIIVEPPGFVYTLNSDKLLNNTRYEYHDRYVDDCYNARISSDIRLLDDTIDYMKSGCKTTNFHEKVTIVKPYSKLNYDGPYYQYLKWLDAAKKLKNINCLKSTEC